MSELTLTLLRLGFLVALWLFVFGTLGVLRRDLSAVARPHARRRPGVVRAARARRRRRQAHLLVALSDGSTRRVELGDQEISFGRGEDNTLRIVDDYTSTHHARISARERGWVIEDCGSTNGTWVERKRITSPTPLAPGMRVRIGRTEITVRT